MPRPVVGITTYIVEARFGAWEAESALSRPTTCGRSASRGTAAARAAVDGRDRGDARRGRRLVFSGGSDIDPELYDARAASRDDGVSRERDEAELALLQAALARDMPVLAICRGSQLLNVACGGDLVQHLPDAVGHDGHKETSGTLLRPRRGGRGGHAAARASRRAVAGEVAPSPGLRQRRRRAARRGPRRGRLAGGARGAGPALRARRALAPGGRRGRPPVRGARRAGGSLPGRTARAEGAGPRGSESAARAASSNGVSANGSSRGCGRRGRRRVAQPLDERPGDAGAHRRDEVQPVRREPRAQHGHLDDQRPAAAQPGDPLDHLAGR